MSKSSIAIIVLLLATITSTWFALKVVKKNTQPLNYQPTMADSFITEATYKKTTPSGEISYIIHTPHATHYQYQNSAKYTKPTITIINKNAAPFVINADQGISEHNARTIHLLGHVILRQHLAAKSQNLTITTTSATINPATKTAVTDQYITMLRPNFKATAVGAQADFAHKTLQLLHHVNEDQLSPATHLQADNAYYDRNHHISTYQGHIYLHHDTDQLTADKLIAYDDNKKIQKIVTTGHPQLIALPKGNHYPLYAIADIIEYYPQKNIVHLIGNAKVTQHNNSFTGQYVTYNTKQQTVDIKPGANAKTVIVFRPQK